MNSIQLNITGMKCGGCVSTVENILKNSDGVENVSVNLLTESAYFEINKKGPNIDQVLENLKQNGFPSKIYINDFSKKVNKVQLEKEKKWINQWKKLNFALLLLLFSGLGHLAEGGFLNLPILGNLFFHAALATLALFFPGREIVIKGFKSLIKNRPDMDSLVALDYYNESLLLEENKIDRGETLKNMAIIYMSNGEEDRSIETYQKALVENPKQPSCLKNIGLIYEKRGRYAEQNGDLDQRDMWFDKAAQVWSKAVRLYPGGYLDIENWLKTSGRSSIDIYL